MAGTKEDPLMEVTPDSNGNIDVTEALLAEVLAASASIDPLQIA